MFLLFLPLSGLPIFNPFGMRFSFGLFLTMIINLYFAFDFWRMKEVELTAAGLIVTERFFFTEKTFFVPFEQIAEVTNDVWWRGGKRRIVLKLNESAEFGKEICFMPKGFRLIGNEEVFYELQRTIGLHQDDRPSAAPRRIAD